MIYVGIKIYILRSCGSSAIVMKPKAKENFRTAVTFLYVLRRINILS
jgi:hypothetical protein